ncbi:filamin A-interacting protein 1-like isoform 1-T1 [Menidia menidia]
MKGERKDWKGKPSREDLSCDDLLFLLSILEGELQQARDEVAAMLRSEGTDLRLLGARYGVGGKEAVLRALRRDAVLAQRGCLEDVHEKSTAELRCSAEAQGSSNKQPTEQIGEGFRARNEALRRIEELERNHETFIHQTKCLVTLQEQDRDRLKLLLTKERKYHEIKDKKKDGELSILKEELTKLKAFALLVVKEQRCLSELVEEQRCKINHLRTIADVIGQGVCASDPRVKKKRALQPSYLQEEQCDRVSNFHLYQNKMAAPSLLTEVEVLRRRVVEMEGKDEELLRMADQCTDLDRRLAKETGTSRRLKAEVDKLSDRISELDRVEEALGKSKQDCNLLKSSLEREREEVNRLSRELDALRLRVRELEAAEGRLEKSEMVVRQDLGKLRSLTVALVEDRKSMAEKLRQAEEKIYWKEGKRNEQAHLATMTERLREERQLALRSRADLEEKIKGIEKEKDEFRDRLKTEEERNRELQSKITIMKKKLNAFDNRKEKEEYTNCSIPNNATYHFQTEDNKVKELNQECDRLQQKLKDREDLEGELRKVKYDYECLGRRLQDEQRRSEALTEELEVTKKELCRYEQAEKLEVNQEHLLLCYLQKEQVKSRLLTREVEALKEKLQKQLGAEESICRGQMDQSALQRKLTEQEAKNQQLTREMDQLKNEVDGYRKGQNRTQDVKKHCSDYHQITKEVQTEPAERIVSDFNGHGGRLDQEKETNQDVANGKSLNTANNNMSRHNSHLEIDPHQVVNGEVMMLTHTSGQPLHIKVTPHHALNTATLKISGPSGEAAASYTSTAVIPASGASPKQRITIIQSPGQSPATHRTPGAGPNRAVSPPDGTPASRLLTQNSTRSLTPDNGGSPIQIVTVRTCSPEPAEAKDQAAFCQTPEQPDGWKRHGSNSADAGPSIITTEDSKIQIHLGSPYIQPMNGTTPGPPQPAGPYYLRHEQRTQVIANGCHVTGVGKITSSITISPANASATHSSNITVSGLCD